MKDILVYDTTNLGDQVGSYIKSAAGTHFTDTAGAMNVYSAHLVALSKAEDAAHVSGDQGLQMLAVRNDAGTSLVSADGDYSPLSLNATGALRIAGTFALNAEKAEDAAHSSGDTGMYSLSVRQDNPASSTSADGDYQSLKTDKLGKLWTNDAGNSFVAAAVSVASTATDLVAVDLPNRIKIMVQNKGAKPIFVGGATVDVTTGWAISPGSSEIFPVGAGADLYAICASGTVDTRLFEIA